MQFFCLDFGGGALRGLVELPHVSGVAGRRDVEAVRRTVAEVAALLDEREHAFTEMGIDSVAAYRRRRATGEITDDPFGDVFLVVDGWGTLRQEYEELEGVVTTIASRGLGFGIHVVITAARWAEIRINLRDMLGTRLELRLGDPGESELDRKAAANVPEKTPGRGINRDKLHVLSAVPRIDGKQRADDLAEGTANLVQRVREGWPYRPAPRVRLLPRLLPAAELAALAGTDGAGHPDRHQRDQTGPGPARLRQRPALLRVRRRRVRQDQPAAADRATIVERYSTDEAMLVIADYRRGLLGAVDSSAPARLRPVGPGVHRDDRRHAGGARPSASPGPDVTADQLRNRSWWKGPDIYVLVDDYDLVAGGGANPLAPLVELLPQARDIGLHVILTRRVGGASRALYDPVIQRMRELDSPGFLMSGNKEEGVLIGNLKPSPQPPGRGTLVRRSDGTQLVQTAYSEPT